MATIITDDEVRRVLRLYDDFKSDNTSREYAMHLALSDTFGPRLARAGQASCACGACLARSADGRV